MKELGITDLMLRAFLECLVLVGIHTYLGIHVIRRKVIFVDLALAQVAALGTTVGFLFGLEPDSWQALYFSVLFTLAAAALFAISRTRGDRVPQEAVIGVVFAVAASVTILVASRGPHGAEHIKEVMSGAIEWVNWGSIGLAAAVYSVIGFLHYLFRRPLLAISHDPEASRATGYNLFGWDFFFYFTFGLVIAISVRTAGVLLVFVFLVVPALLVSMFTDRVLYQLLWGWALGVAVTVAGLLGAYFGDLPAGPSVVAVYGAVLAMAALFAYLVHTGDRKKALIKISFGFLALLVFAALVWLSGKLLSPP